MRTPSDDEPGQTPLATARPRSGDGDGGTYGDGDARGNGQGIGHGTSAHPARPLAALRGRLRSLAKATASQATRIVPAFPGGSTPPPRPRNEAPPNPGNGAPPPNPANGAPPASSTPPAPDAPVRTPLAIDPPSSPGGTSGNGHHWPQTTGSLYPAGLAEPIGPLRFTGPEPPAGPRPAEQEHAGQEHAGQEHAGQEHAGQEHAGQDFTGPERSARRFRLPRWPGRLRPSPRWARRLILAAWPIGLAAAGIGLYLCYLALSRTQEVTSDGASNALQAWAMLHGNPLLRGWTVTDVSFYTTELPEYMIVEAVRGLNADVLHASAAITYSLVVLVGGLLGRGRATGREGAVRLLIAAGILVAPQLGPGIFILIFQPDHTGTAVPLMLTWLVLDRAPRRWFVPPIIAVMLAWGAIADSLVLLIGVAPLAAVAAIRAYQALIQRREGWRAGWYDVALLVAAAAGAEISRVVVREISAHGGYTVLPVQGGITQVTEMSSHLWLLVQSIVGIYGADLFGMTSIGLAGAIAILHLVGLALAGWGLWLAVRRFFSCADMIAQILAVGIGINLIAYLLSTTPQTYWSAREVAVVLPYGAVLAARMLGARLMKARMIPALAVALACYLAALGWSVTATPIPAVTQNLADWLAANHLTYGLSSYGIGNTTTLASGETVDVRPVSWENNDAAGGPYEFDKSWYDPRLHYANFVILIEPPIPIDPIAYWEILDTFGKPQHTYTFERYTILTYNTNLLTDLSPALPPPPAS
jgi:hypothetical protein